MTDEAPPLGRSPPHTGAKRRLSRALWAVLMVVALLRLSLRFDEIAVFEDLATLLRARSCASDLTVPAKLLKRAMFVRSSVRMDLL